LAINATTGLPDCTALAGYPVGQLSNCRPGTSDTDVLPPEQADVTSTTPEAGAPSTDPLAVPADMPTGDTL